MARLAGRAGVDLILVGDSVGTTQLGFDSTVPVTLDMMVHHSAAVARARPEALVVADLPFAEAWLGRETLLRSCRRLIQEGGAEAVKIEGGADLAPDIAVLVAAGIPVLGHIGLLPQRVHELGGYRRYGRTEAGRQRLLADATALEEAGCFALIGEMIEPTAAEALTAALKVPFIGIGCGPGCDGQILVLNDLLGLTPSPPSFVRTYADLGTAVEQALRAYGEDVRERRFPSSSTGSTEEPL